MDLSQLLTLHNTMIVEDYPVYEELPETPTVVVVDYFLDIRDLVRIKKLILAEQEGTLDELLETWNNYVYPDGYPRRTYQYFDVDRDGVVTEADQIAVQKGILQSSFGDDDIIDKEETLRSGYLTFIEPEPRIITTYADLSDLVATAQIAAGWEGMDPTTQEYQEKHPVAEGYPPRTYDYYDVNYDGVIDQEDVQHMARYLAGWNDYALDREKTMETGHLTILKDNT